MDQVRLRDFRDAYREVSRYSLNEKAQLPKTTYSPTTSAYPGEIIEPAKPDPERGRHYDIAKHRDAATEHLEQARFHADKCSFHGDAAKNWDLIDKAVASYHSQLQKAHHGAHDAHAGLAGWNLDKIEKLTPGQKKK